MIVSAAIFDDVIGLALLAIVLSVIATGAAPHPVTMLILVGKVALFFIITVAAGLFLAALLTVAFLGKIVGAGVPARLAGLSSRDAAAVGIGMSGRGAVELVVVSIAHKAGLFDQPDELVANLFSALVITAVVTTMAMPIALRILLGTTKISNDRRDKRRP
jgi:Kef-type K+ transport system membrane component KefB